MAVVLTLSSLLLLIVSAVAYFYQRPVLLSFAGGLFFIAASPGTYMVWTQVSHILAAFIWSLTLGVSMVCLLVFLIDFIWAPFCLEMRYLTLLPWILAPMAVVLEFVGFGF